MIQPIETQLVPMSKSINLEQMLIDFYLPTHPARYDGSYSPSYTVLSHIKNLADLNSMLHPSSTLANQNQAQKTSRPPNQIHLLILNIL